MITDFTRRAVDRALSELPSGLALHYQFLKAHGLVGDFKKPRLFSEMVQARKLYDRQPDFRPPH